MVQNGIRRKKMAEYMAYVPDEIKDRSLCFSEDIALTINALKQSFKL